MAWLEVCTSFRVSGAGTITDYCLQWSIGADTLVMANVTLLSTDGRPLINMESFESSTKNVECGEKMKLEFISKEAFDSAVAAWGWVNEDETHEFIMIANHENCSPADQRTPYQ